MRIGYNKKRIGFKLIVLIIVCGGVAFVCTDYSSKKSKADLEPPKIQGTHNQTVYIGDTISYKRGVTVTDNADKGAKLQVDSSEVNLKKAGLYYVVYKAKDSSGNTNTVKTTVTVMEKSKETAEESSSNNQKLDKLADDVLSIIIKEGMSKKEKAKAIYEWNKNHIIYSDSSDKSDWVKAAIQGLTLGSGDCFVYFSTAQELLTRASIPNKKIQKSDGHHYWNLVDYGQGWYHFDTTPHKGDTVPYSLFMLTDNQLKEYSEKNDNSHTWDATKYPSTPLK